MDIKARIGELNAQWQVIRLEIEQLQAQCKHPEFVRGLTIVACIQEVDICATCGWAKPIDFIKGGYAVYPQ